MQIYKRNQKKTNSKTDIFKTKNRLSLLKNHFIDQICSETGMQPREIDADAMQLLVEKSWTGNIRELRNVVERLLILSGSRITAADVKAYVL